MSDAARGAALRVAAARVVRAVRFDGVSLKAAIAPVLGQFEDARDRALCEAICFETCRWALRYERLLARLMPRPLPPALRDLHALLLTGLAQLDAMKLADYAAISSTAEAARGLKRPRHVALVNAVLRRYLREREALEIEIEQTGDGLAEHAHPLWLADLLQRDWDHAAWIMSENNRAAPLWLRVNRMRGDLDAYAKELHAAGIEAHELVYAPDALCLAQGVAPGRLPGWDAGKVSIQDLSAQLCVEAVAAAPGMRVLDACAAPGGKSAHLLERSGGRIELLALDIDQRRLQRVDETLARLGLTATTRVADATDPSWWDGRHFDRILLDAPCSGSGVIRRQPDIKLHRRQADLPALIALQARLLDALWPMLRSGGRLVYATCSVLKDENERQIDAFLARTPSARAVRLPDHFGRGSGAGHQRFPGDDHGDGFFHAVLERIV
ncbi:MAG: 16S rRNA (cytosine(967)-C(5))-methyltransferase RsmB [Chiayiivirga sp.]|jgi:16S rRNA (cytosine967-C5)-methyltransferase|uniref:16S rRNA (cytosine(967)-C(5))-methyltransferase RsmB n=1 Tax=Chiayiivirga sp. TaxID=2041042 RepID=UPI0025BBC0D1|nr:16S rRNA (cytosine(967)-C(5))-methyltransferase RsmB [Chiayiivirga sp.]MCI1711141.1 16S rRNA (cytosine(967)-C(5))-methyltransferase RsmB [Chiayiivirga sp.]MCI1728062.1 16S rRNA (cytosine(967)-C(5))-methyltransferase RsmB [Chiayiivirga sp.]